MCRLSRSSPSLFAIDRARLERAGQVWFRDRVTTPSFVERASEYAVVVTCITIPGLASRLSSHRTEKERARRRLAFLSSLSLQGGCCRGPSHGRRGVSDYARFP